MGPAGPGAGTDVRSRSSGACAGPPRLEAHAPVGGVVFGPGHAEEVEQSLGPLCLRVLRASGREVLRVELLDPLEEHVGGVRVVHFCEAQRHVSRQGPGLDVRDVGDHVGQGALRKARRHGLQGLLSELGLVAPAAAAPPPARAAPAPAPRVLVEQLLVPGPGLEAGDLGLGLAPREVALLDPALGDRLGPEVALAERGPAEEGGQPRPGGDRRPLAGLVEGPLLELPLQLGLLLLELQRLAGAVLCHPLVLGPEPALRVGVAAVVLGHGLLRQPLLPCLNRQLVGSGKIVVPSRHGLALALLVSQELVLERLLRRVLLGPEAG